MPMAATFFITVQYSRPTTSSVSSTRKLCDRKASAHALAASWSGLAMTAAVGRPWAISPARHGPPMATIRWWPISSR
jgi:hypothetical protein